MEVSLLRVTDNPTELICLAYGICTKREVTPDRLLKYIRMGHLSPLEHAVATFYISGISRVCSHQLVRHRLASYSQVSQRYVGQEGGGFVVPRTVLARDDVALDYRRHVEQSKLLYMQLVNRGIPKEDARYVLPSAMSTELIMTANFREWLHIMKLRMDASAQWEIRDVVGQVYDRLSCVCPEVFNERVLALLSGGVDSG